MSLYTERISGHHNAVAGWVNAYRIVDALWVFQSKKDRQFYVRDLRGGRPYTEEALWSVNGCPTEGFDIGPYETLDVALKLAQFLI